MASILARLWGVKMQRQPGRYARRARIMVEPNGSMRGLCDIRCHAQRYDVCEDVVMRAGQWLYGRRASFHNKAEFLIVVRWACGTIGVVKGHEHRKLYPSRATSTVWSERDWRDDDTIRIPIESFEVVKSETVKRARGDPAPRIVAGEPARQLALFGAGASH